MKMINSRLYYDIKELPTGGLNFHYYTDEISENFNDLKSYSKKVNHKEILPTLYEIGIQKMLYNINEAEFSRLLNEIEDYVDHINELECTYPMEANIALAKMWGPNELQRKFIQWFKNNGYAVPNGK